MAISCRVSRKRSGISMSLQMLDMSGNQLSSLPEAIGHLQSLTSLIWTRISCRVSRRRSGNLNHSKSSPWGVIICRLSRRRLGILTSLQTLWSELDNQLSSLPEAIGNLNVLSYLDLHSNQLSSLPEAIGQTLFTPKTIFEL